MQANVQIPENKFVDDLGNGHSYVNFDREEKQLTDESGTKTVVVAAMQYHVMNPVTRDRIINAVINDNYPDGKSEMALRKGILNNQDPDFVAFNAFAESIKQKCTNEGF